MRILGLDPGIAIVGWGVVDSENFKYKPIAYDSIMTAAGLEVEECPVTGATTNEAGETTSVGVDLVPFGFQTGILIAEE